MRLWRWAQAKNRQAAPDDDADEARGIAWERLSPLARAAWEIWRDIAGQVYVLSDQVAKARDLVFILRMDSFRTAAQWQGLDPEDPSTRDVWQMVTMLHEHSYNQRSREESYCWHPHPEDPTGLLTEFVDWCSSCVAIVEVDDGR